MTAPFCLSGFPSQIQIYIEQSSEIMQIVGKVCLCVCVPAL